MVSKKLLVLLGVACALAIVATPAAAEMVVAGQHVAYVKVFDVTHGMTTIAGLSFDPSYVNGDGDYDRVYIADREPAADGGGLYSATISTGTSSSRLALAYDEPYDTVVDSSGNVYVCFSGSAAIYKVTDPLGTPTETQMLKNYGFATSGSPSDDDPVSIDLMPAGFGLAGYGAGDLLLLDNGLDWNEREALTAVSKNSLSTNQIYHNVWNDGDPAGGNNNDVRGKVSVVDNKFYFSRMTVPTVTLGGTDYPVIYRMGGDGVLETIALNLPAGETFVNLDDSLTVNPADGSVWFVKYDADNRRVVFRADVTSATAQGGGVYLANATSEITWDAADNFNVGVNDLAWSPDGKTLIVGCPSGTDTIRVFEAVPEPTSFLMMTIGLMFVAAVRRRK